ncbi:MAG: type II secretion system protein N [Sulfurimicrobium sp.]|nr:type II secretion system protein N [Sulfurimicrobium sp.]MDO9191216.1 type II secretion system protein N [Sulfurimicrobium sp.]MDP2198624.1 type II secretion system protein N [Sulfurimicrobium sp.]MDP3686554.1 type II secretion system protein N [Sulfurimicrobium sp.]MDZ7655431.1 type II secretion system protein N [Sulfurimicrobium sp.]
MKLLSWLAGGLLYLAFLAATAPASTLFWLANRFAAAGITTSAASGTLWRGEARDVSFTPPGGKAIGLERLAWNIRPLGLAFGQLPVDIEFSGTEARGQGTLRLTPSGLDITQLDATLPAVWLAHIQPRLETFRLEGAITLRSKEFSLRQDHYQGQGEILWQQAAFGLSQVKPVGNYRGEIGGKGERIQLQLQTQNGPLELAGSGTWSKQSGIHFIGTAKARERESELTPLLRLLGRPDPSGFYALKF